MRTAIALTIALTLALACSAQAAHITDQFVDHFDYATLVDFVGASGAYSQETFPDPPGSDYSEALIDTTNHRARLDCRGHGGTVMINTNDTIAFDENAKTVIDVSNIYTMTDMRMRFGLTSVDNPSRHLVVETVGGSSPILRLRSWDESGDNDILAGNTSIGTSNGDWRFEIEGSRLEVFLDEGSGYVSKLSINDWGPAHADYINLGSSVRGMLWAYNGRSEGGDRRTDFDNFVITVPEPATMGLLGMGGLSLLKRKRR